jgi:hypothetical protein
MADAGLVAQPGGGLELGTVKLPSRCIGRRRFDGWSVTARGLQVTYQQKLYVSGSIAPTFGATYKGTGATFGRGGSIGSENESVVTVVYVDGDGVEGTTELPSGTSVREGTVFRMDHLGPNMFAVRNLSGNQSTRFLLSPADFIPSVGFRKRDIALVLFAAMALAAMNLPWVALLLARPSYVLWRIREARRQREQLAEYMAQVAS